MKTIAAAKALFAFLFACGSAQAADGFQSVKCGGDIPGALIGQHMTNERAVVIERRHAALDLKNLGADDISDLLDSTSWRICGKEYILISDDRDIVRDALLFPAHSRRAPQFVGEPCQIGETKLPDYVIAVLDNATADVGGAAHYSPQDKALLPATAAWKVDEKKDKFVRIESNGLRCPRSGIVTADGGP